MDINKINHTSEQLLGPEISAVCTLLEMTRKQLL
jgi:hypothetical protein